MSLKMFLLGGLFASQALFGKVPTCRELEPQEKLAEEAQKVLDAFLLFQPENLVRKIHPRLKVSMKEISSLISHVSIGGGGHLRGSVYKLWFIDNPSHEAKYVPCGEAQVLTHYGYEQQVSVFLEFTGDSETLRTYFTLVPKEGKWLIGSLKSQKWTYLKKDPSAWLAESLKQKTQPIFFFMHADLALKLADWSPLLKLRLGDEIRKIKEKTFPDKMFLESIQALLGPFSLHQIQTLFAQDGVGLKVILKKSPDLIGTEKMEEQNQQILKKLRQDLLFLKSVVISYVSSDMKEWSSRSYTL